MNFSQDTLDRVKVVIVKTLGIQDRADTVEASTELFGSMPELELDGGRQHLRSTLKQRYGELRNRRRGLHRGCL